jgi:hypothetical protein
VRKWTRKDNALTAEGQFIARLDGLESEDLEFQFIVVDAVVCTMFVSNVKF